MLKQAIALGLTLLIEVSVILIMIQLIALLKLKKQKRGQENQADALLAKSVEAVASLPLSETAKSRHYPGLILTILAASLCTHPIAWLVNQNPIFGLSSYQRWMLIEGVVLMVEGLFYLRFFSFPLAFSLSLIANLSSAILGLKIYLMLINGL